MKKSLVILASFAFASVMSAATITWQSGTLYTSADTSVKAKATVNASYYLISASDYGTLGSASLADKLKFAEEKTADYSAKSASTTSAANWKWESAVAGNTYYVLAIYQDTAADPAKYIATVATGTSPGTGVAQTVANISAGGKGWEAVPEPCSVALIALGLAAFGLKRKVA